jgi:iron complex outermembrane receptor protein
MKSTPSMAKFRPTLSSAATLRLTALASLLLLTGLQTQAQTTVQSGDTRKLERVEVTGSSIKRIENEGSLPVQVITRADIIKSGVTVTA